MRVTVIWPFSTRLGAVRIPQPTTMLLSDGKEFALDLS